MNLTDETKQKVTDSPLLVALTDEQIDTFFGAGAIVQFAPGDQIIAQNAYGDALYLIIQGRVMIQGEAAEQLATLSGEPTMHEQYEGDFFGEMSFLDHEPASATVTAVDNVTAFRIEKERLFELFAHDTEFQVVLLTNMGRILSRRLRRSNVRVANRALE